jgi:predicted nucleic acid-binding protein
MRLYLDASPLIYWVEKAAAYYPQVDARIKQAGVTLVSSHLALLECLVLPLRQGQSGLQQDYDDFFATQVTDLVPFTESVFRKAADIRAKHNFRTPDALHLAAALVGACDVFLTNDAALKTFPDIAVEVVS